MTDSVQNNKRIAKNTLLLYVRMLFMMAVSLYTSRVVLNTLGVVDYGIYNVVGGVVAMFGFINASMSSATQRFITFALGKGDQENLQKVFSTSLQIHFLIALIIVLLGETLGLWFLNEKMQIPDNRMDAAFWVYQCSVLSTVVMILSVPYNATIIAHEKMSAFAYISILEVVLKLAIVYILWIGSFDKLILYAGLVLAVQVLIRFCYSVYCNKYFAETKYRHIWEKALFKEMTGFAVWSLFGNFSAVLYGQGLNIFLNLFFGPLVNAARAISIQVQSAIQQFVSNFQMALNPQITKTYAQGDLNAMHQLMFRSARFSFFLLFLLSLPVLFETEYILTLWLKIVPDYTIVFLRIIICTSLIYTFSNPLIIANQATGQVKKYQVVCGSILLLILPISYIFLKLGFPPYSVFIVHFIMEMITQLARIIMLRSYIGIRLKDYVKNIYIPAFVVVLISILIPLYVYVSMEPTTLRFLIMCLVCMISVSFVSFFIGLSKSERNFVFSRLFRISRNVLDQKS